MCFNFCVTCFVDRIDKLLPPENKNNFKRQENQNREETGRNRGGGARRKRREGQEVPGEYREREATMTVADVIFMKQPIRRQ